MEKYKIKHGSGAGYSDWMYYEYGSWEDHNQPKEGHVYCILKREEEKKYMEVTKEEVVMLIESLETKMWFNNLEDERTVKACWRGYLNRLKKII